MTSLECLDSSVELARDAGRLEDLTKAHPGTALALPLLGGTPTDLSLTATQSFGSNVSVTAGKFNMLDAAARTPIMGGGGETTFWNTAFAAPRR